MTREVSEKIARGIKDKIECNTADIDDWAEFWGFTREEYEEFLDMAIKALELEFCEDAISRQAAIRWVKAECNPYGKPTLDFESGKKVIEHLKKMSPVNPQQKTGHWIDKTYQSACGVIFYRIECSECGKASGLSHTSAEYCPHCGAKMIESEESEGME